jgi:hypothetical protein
VDESREYGTWTDRLWVLRHTFSAVFRCGDRSRSGLPGDVPSVPAGVRPRGKLNRGLLVSAWQSSSSRCTPGRSSDQELTKKLSSTRQTPRLTATDTGQSPARKFQCCVNTSSASSFQPSFARSSALIRSYPLRAITLRRARRKHERAAKSGLHRDRRRGCRSPSLRRWSAVPSTTRAHPGWRGKDQSFRRAPPDKLTIQATRRCSGYPSIRSRPPM